MQQHNYEFGRLAGATVHDTEVKCKLLIRSLCCKDMCKEVMAGLLMVGNVQWITLCIW
jgi:hypothetical protein